MEKGKSEILFFILVPPSLSIYLPKGLLYKIFLSKDVYFLNFVPNPKRASIPELRERTAEGSERGRTGESPRGVAKKAGFLPLAFSYLPRIWPASLLNERRGKVAPTKSMLATTKPGGREPSDKNRASPEYPFCEARAGSRKAHYNSASTESSNEIKKCSAGTCA